MGEINQGGNMISSDMVLPAPANNPQANVVPQKEYSTLSKDRWVNYTAENVELLYLAMEVFKGVMHAPLWAATHLKDAPDGAVSSIALSLPKALLGAVALAFFNVAEAGERAAAMVATAVRGPSPEEQRLHLTRLFVQRMQSILKENDKRAVFFVDHPDQLINATAIAVAFLSRDLAQAHLKVGDSVLTEDHVKKMGPYQQQCVGHISKIKEAVQGLLPNGGQWEDLMGMINGHALVKVHVKPEEGWVTLHDFTLVPKDSTKAPLAPDKLEHLKNLIIHTFSFSDLVAHDPVFKREWWSSFHKIR